LDNGFEFEKIEIEAVNVDTTTLTPENTSSGFYTLEYTTNSDGDIDEIKVYGLQIQYVDYNLKIIGKQTNVDDGIRHKFLLNYNEVTYTAVDKNDMTSLVNTQTGVIYCTKEDGKYVVQENLTQFDTDVQYYIKDIVPKENYIAYYADDTNIVDTKSAWQYLNIKKVIDEQDPDQTFIFKVERYENEESESPTDTFYVDIRCNTADSENSNYYGEQSLVLGKRGVYKVTEVTDWSSTDYTTTPTASISEDIKNAKAKDGVATITLPANSVKSTAFKLTDTYSQTNAADTKAKAIFKLDTDKISTLTFKNVKKEKQVWKTSQAFALNSIDVAQVTTTTE
jgi:hypothetical protein